MATGDTDCPTCLTKILAWKPCRYDVGDRERVQSSNIGREVCFWESMSEHPVCGGINFAKEFRLQTLTPKALFNPSDPRKQSDRLHFFTLEIT